MVGGVRSGLKSQLTNIEPLVGRSAPAYLSAQTHSPYYRNDTAHQPNLIERFRPSWQVGNDVPALAALNSHGVLREDQMASFVATSRAQKRLIHVLRCTPRLRQTTVSVRWH